MRKFVLSLDYELYGNGSGDVFQHIIDPTDRLLDIARRYGAHFTIFFEVVEYWKLKEEWEKGNKMGYKKNPITAMEFQLQKAYQEGHDIQLHLHPQWVDAVWHDKHWEVNCDDWKLSKYDKDGQYSLVNLLRNGKRSIERIVQSVSSNYQCIALRAGGYNAQPSERIIEAMHEAGIFVDSSIYPGGKENGALSCYDYSNVPIDLGFWNVGHDLETIGTTDLMEFPIVAFPIARWKKYVSLERLKSLLQNRKSAQESFEAKLSGENARGGLGRIKFFFEKEWQTWDYCLFSSAMHRRFLSSINKQRDRNIFVLVGHPKSFVRGKGFEYLLRRTYKEVRYETLSSIFYTSLKNKK